LINEFFSLSVKEQKEMPISEWLDYYNVSIKKLKQKLEWMSLNHQ
jgi:hypothetical protein